MGGQDFVDVALPGGLRRWNEVGQGGAGLRPALGRSGRSWSFALQSPKPPLPRHSAKPRAKLLMPLDFVPIVLALLIDQKFYILWTI